MASDPQKVLSQYQLTGSSESLKTASPKYLQLVGTHLFISTETKGPAPDYLHALDLSNPGEPAWPRPRQFPDAKINGFIDASAIFPDKGTTVLLSLTSADMLRGKGELVAVNAQNETIWTWTHGGQHVSAAALYEDRIWCITDGQTVRSLNPHEPASEQTFSLPISASLAAPLVQTDAIIIPSRSPQMLNIDRDGEVRWHFQSPSTTYAWLDRTPIAVEKLVIAAFSTGHVICLNATDGRQVWLAEVGPGKRHLSLPISDGEHLFVGARDGLHAVALTTGQPLWHFETGRQVTSAPVIHDDTLFFSCEDHYVYGVAVADGREVWRSEPFERRLELPPIIVGGAVYAIDRSGTIRALQREGIPLDNADTPIASAPEIVAAAQKKSGGLLGRLWGWRKDATSLEEKAERLADNDKATDHERALAWQKAGDAWSGGNGPERAALCFRRAAAYFEATGDKWQSVILYEKAALNHETAEEWDLAANLWRKLQDWSKTGLALEKHLDNLELQGAKTALERASTWEKAADAWHQADVAYRSRKGYAEAAHLWLQTGQFDKSARLYEAIDEWAKAAALWQRLRRPRKEADALEKHAEQVEAAEGAESEEKARAWEKVGAAWQQLNEPDRAQAGYAKAAALWEKSGDLEKAALDYETAALWQPAARAWQELGRPTRRAQALESLALKLRLLTDSPAESMAQAWQTAGDAWRDADDLERSALCYHDATILWKEAGQLEKVAVQSEAAGDWLQAARVWEQLRRWPERAAALEKHLALLDSEATTDADRAVSWQTLAAAFDVAGNMAKARFGYLESARLWQLAGQEKEAATQFEAAKMWDEAAEIWHRLGRWGREAAAREAFAIALAKAENSDLAALTAAWRRAAEAWQSLEDVENAERCYDAIVEIWENEPHSDARQTQFEQIAVAYEALNQWGQAAAIWREIRAWRQEATALQKYAEGLESLSSVSNEEKATAWQTVVEAWKGEDDRDQVLAAEKEVARHSGAPIVRVHVVNCDMLVKGMYSSIDLVLTNEGFGVAQSISVKGTGDAFSGDMTYTMRLFSLRPGQQRRHQVSVLPEHHGNAVPLRIRVEYMDEALNEHLSQQTMYVDVDDVPEARNKLYQVPLGGAGSQPGTGGRTPAGAWSGNSSDLIEVPGSQNTLSLAVSSTAVELKFGNETYNGPNRIDMAALRGTSLMSEYGQSIFTGLIHGEDNNGGWQNATLTGYAHALRDTEDFALELKLSPNDPNPDLHTLRWETVRDKQGKPLAARQRQPFYRRVETNTRKKRIDAGQLQALVLICNPASLAEPDNRILASLAKIVVEQEVKILNDALKQLIAHDLARVTILNQTHGRPATFDNLRQELLRLGPDAHHILHLICHGVFVRDKYYLVFENEDPDKPHDFVAAERLNEVVEDSELRLVILGACQSARNESGQVLHGLGPDLVRSGVPSVIAMQDLLPYDTAAAFNRHFYNDLARSGRVDMAMAATRAAIYVKDGPDSPTWGIPVLFMGTSDGWLFGMDRHRVDQLPRLTTNF